MQPPLVFETIRQSVNRLASEANQAPRSKLAPALSITISEDYEQRIQRWVQSMTPLQLARKYTIFEVMELAKLPGRFRVHASQRYTGEALRRCGFVSKRDWTSAGRNKRFWMKGK